MIELPPRKTMWRAFREKDSQFDGVFLVAVRTTGVFCRPVCRAKPPRPENVEFFPTAAHATAHGYRPCKICRPLDPPDGRPPAVVRRLLELARANPQDRPIRSGDLEAMGIDPATARRQFRQYCDMTFAGYQRAVRMNLALERVRAGGEVTPAQVAAGYESGSGFRQAFKRTFGGAASDGGGITTLYSARISTPVGPMLAVATDGGLHVLDFLDRKGLAGAIARVRRRFANAEGAPAAIVPVDHRHLAAARAQLEEYFAGRRRAFSLELAPAGSTFERLAWGFLQSIPYGQTRTYAEQAREIDRPAAVRAVGRANGMNYLSIVIPCHRVVGAGGALTGYGGGVWRKRWLLAHERRVAGGGAT
jgi:AraC family transcriptional regulator of adaptative response/methylated-DNA-[protein]-cysteine methyltransferase